MLKRALKYCSKDNYFAVSLILVLIGAVVWSLTMVKSGLVYSFGMGFWGPNGHDGIWHLALINNLSKFTLEVPVFSGEVLKNYHIGFDLIVALIHKLTKVSPVNLYFQVVPPVLAFAIGLFAYKFVYLWKKSRTYAFWATFFVYFGGSFGWLVNLLRGEKVGGESMFWSQQSVSTLINPPYALSLVTILLGLIVLIKYLKNNKTIFLITASLLFGMLIQIKAYAGILVLAGLFCAAFWQLIKEKKTHLVKVTLGALTISVILYLLPKSDGGKVFIFQPFWFLETMMGLTDRLGWLKFYSAMTNYRMGGIWIKAILAYLVAFFIFLAGNMGTRIVAFASWLPPFGKKHGGDIAPLNVFMGTIILAGIIIPMFFLQKGTPWNTIQFFYYSLFFSGMLAGVSMGEWLKKNTARLNRVVACGAVVLFTIPTTIGTMRHYLPARPPAMLSGEELEALEFLAEQPDGVVLTYPFDMFKAAEAESSPPRPLYLYVSSAYVAAFSDKTVFLEDEVNLDITGYEWKERRQEVFSFVSTLDQKEAREFLEKNRIRYLYLVRALSPLPGEKFKVGEGQLGLENIFENKIVDIYKVLNGSTW